MKHFLQTTWLMLLCLFIGIGSAWAADATFTFSAQGYSNGQVLTSGTIDAYTSWSATKGGSNDPKYYDTGTGLRVYSGGTFGITSTKTIASITLTFSATSTTFSTSNTTNPQTVTPNATSYSWNVSRTCRLQKIEVTYASGGDPDPEPTTYNVTVANNITNGTVTASPTSATAGTEITLTATPATNYEFGSWSVTDASSNAITVTDNKFTMPASNVTVGATFNQTQGGGGTGGEGTWTLCSLTDLTSSDIFVIVDAYSGKAMTNNNGTSNPPSAAVVTISEDGNTVTGVTDVMKWNISGNSSNGYTFYPNGTTSTWLYCTNTNNGVRVGTNTSKTFSLVGKHLKHAGTSRYVGVYNSSDWRCYTSTTGNIADTDTKFFKYSAGPSKTLVSIVVSGTPTKTTYTEGESFEPAGLIVTGHYDDESDETITKGITWSTPAALTAGQTSVSITATVNGVTSDEYTVTGLTVKEPVTLSSIAVSGTPAEFWKGDTFNHDGITVTATWSDESTTDVTSSCSFSGYDMSAAGEQTVTVTYQDKTATYNIVVKTIANTQATAYTVAEAKALIDADKDLTTEVYVKGIVSKIVTAWNNQYSNITYNISDDGQTTSDQFQLYRCKTNGANVGSEVIAYGELYKHTDGTYELKAGNEIVDIQEPAAKTITALAVSGTPTKTTYNVGDAFDPTGLTVTATYSDDTQAIITTGFDWEIDYGTGNEALVAGATSVDVMVYTDDVMSEVYTVEGLTVNVPVTLTSIAVSGTPTKTTYYAGDAFETAGLVVTGTYSDSHQETITEGIEWTIDPETLAEGTTSVDVMASVGFVVSEVYTVNGLTVEEKPQEMVVDFESDASTYVDWDFDNITPQYTNANVTAHGGAKMGATVNASYNGVASASMTTKSKVAFPQNITFYVSKVSDNTKASSWYVEVSTDGESWTKVKTQSATSMTKGNWVEVSQDLREYQNVYVRISYSGSTAIRCIDDVELTYSKYVPVTFKAAGLGYATVYCDHALSIPEGVEVYYATLKDNGNMDTHELTDVIPAETGVVLKYTRELNADEVVVFAYTNEAGDDASDNILTGTVTEIRNPGNAYVFSVVNGVPGFYKFVEGGILGANKAYYVPSTTSDVQSFVLDFEGLTTGISNVSTGSSLNGSFDLQGRRVNAATRGLFIQNGKKVIR